MLNLDQDHYNAAVLLVRAAGFVSLAHLNRNLSCGYGQVALIVSTMEQNHIVSTMRRDGSREILTIP